MPLLSDSESVWPENHCCSLEQQLHLAGQQRRRLLEALPGPEKAVASVA